MKFDWLEPTTVRVLPTLTGDHQDKAHERAVRVGCWEVTNVIAITKGCGRYFNCSGVASTSLCPQSFPLFPRRKHCQCQTKFLCAIGAALPSDPMVTVSGFCQLKEDLLPFAPGMWEHDEALTYSPHCRRRLSTFDVSFPARK